MSTQATGNTLIHSKWVSGALYFYEKTVGRTATGDVLSLSTSAVTIGGTGQDVDFAVYGTGSLSAVFDVGAATLALTGWAITSTGTLTTGASAAGVDVKFWGTTAGCSALWDTSADQLILTQTNASTSGVERTVDISQTHTGIGASAEALRVVLTTETKGGSYQNAIFGKIDYGTTGLVTGLAGVICSELTMPGGAVAGGAGTYCTYEAEINLPTSYAGTVPLAVFTINTWGAQKADFDTYGYLFDINGPASGSGKFWYDATNGTTDDWLRIRINGATKYIMLSDAQTEA